MKERSNTDDTLTKPSFLQKFAGKLNIITKHGEIQDDQQLKLPLINNITSKRSNTQLFRTSKKSESNHSLDFQRNFTSKSAMSNNRAQKYLTHNFDRNLADISNNLAKNSSSKGIKKQRLHRRSIDYLEPLSAVPLSQKFKKIARYDQQTKLTSNIQTKLIGNIENHYRKHSDYSSFLNELNMISNVAKYKHTAT